MEPAAPSIDEPRTALSAAPWLRVPLALLCALLAALALPAVGSAAPQPDAAPQAPAPAPDPAPQAGPPPQQTLPAPTTSSPSPAPTTSSAPITPSAVAPATETPVTGGASKREARRTANQPANRQRADGPEQTPHTARAHRSPTDPSAIARIGAFLPGSSTDDSRSGHLLFLAACALLALLCASGSFLSVATRISRGQLR